MPGRISDHIRSNVWGITACFIALMGTAVVASASNSGPEATKSVVTTKKFKKLKKRVAALEGKTSYRPNGPAGGELGGTYPNPSVGTVNGLDLAASTSPTGGINFGADTSLYRFAPGQLATGGMIGANFVAIDLPTGTSSRITPGGLEITPGSIAGSGRILLDEITAGTGNPPSNQIRIYARDNGSGATQLIAVFPGGPDVVVLATDPNP